MFNYINLLSSNKIKRIISVLILYFASFLLKLKYINIYYNELIIYSTRNNKVSSLNKIV